MSAAVTISRIHSNAAPGCRSKHACLSHDSHTTILLGAAILQQLHFFQPAKEAAGSEGMLGAQKVLQMGLLHDASAFFGLHVDSSL